MEMREIGQSGLRVAPVALGTWAIGGGSWWGDAQDEESVVAIRTALDAGINLIDTAPVYGFGHSEEVVGRAIEGRREEVILSTKCGLWWKDDRGEAFFELDGYNVNRCLKPETIRIEVEDSLRRLKTDYIDILHTHWQETKADGTPIAETMDALMVLKKEGKIRAIAVSNCTPEQMDAYRAAGPLDANQPRYSLLDRSIEADLLPYCREHNIAVLAYSPLEQGLLTGKIGMDYELSEEEFRNTIPWFRPENRQKVLTMLDGWGALTKTYDCTLPQLVIACTIAQPGLTVALCGSRHAGHSQANARAGELVLDAGDIARMRADVEALGAPLM